MSPSPSEQRERRGGGRVHYYNARLIDPGSSYDGPGGVLTEGRVIAGAGRTLFAKGEAPDAEAIDCEGLVLAPGLIDMRVFTGEPGSEARETVRSASKAAAAGGVTTMIVMPNTDPVIDDVALVDFIERRARDRAFVHVHPMAALTKGLKGEIMTEIGLLAEAGAVAFTDGDRAIANPRLLRRALSYAATFDVLVVQHAEDPELAKGGAMNESALSMRLGLAGIPSLAEIIIAERDMRLVEITGARYHLAQCSTAETLEIIARAKARGLPVTCGVSAAHLALNENDVANYRTFFKTSPPLRSEDDRLALVEGVRGGLIDVIVSGHDPQGPENKRLPFGEASFGAIGVETLLSVALTTLHHQAGLSLLDVLRPLTIGPARILRLPAGRLAAQAPADLVLFDPDIPFVLEADSLRSRSKNTPFDERRLQGLAQRTVVSGATVYSAKAASL